MASLFETFLTNIENMIGGMVAGEGADTPSAGYNFTWSADNVNAFDMAKKKAGPWADIEIEGEIPAEGDGLTAGQTDSYWNLKITLGFKYGVVQPNVMRQAQIDAMKCYDDIKRLFGRDATNPEGSQSGAMSLNRQDRPVVFIAVSNDMLNPGIIETFWRVKIYADRRNPDLRTL